MRDFPVLFKAYLIFKDFSRKPYKFKYFLSLCEPCISWSYSHFKLITLLKQSIVIRLQRGTCIKGLFWPPLEPKVENCFSPISFDWFIRKILEVKNFGIYSNFTVAMVTKMANKIVLKLRNCHFEPNLRLLETYF